MDSLEQKFVFVSNRLMFKKADDVGRPRIIVPAHLGEGLDRYKAQDLKLPSGGFVRGQPIPWHHESIPDPLYHVTTNAQGVRDKGMLLAGGVGGLGGDGRDQHVSLTASPKIAAGLKRDMQMMARIGKAVGPEPEYLTPERAAWGKKLVPLLANEAKNQGWNWSDATDPRYNHAYPNYNFQDWTTNFFNTRHSAFPKGHPQHDNFKNPIFFGAKPDYWGKIDPNNIDVIHVPKKNLNTGSLVTDFDLGQGSLDEIRHHGDIPI